MSRHRQLLSTRFLHRFNFYRLTKLLCLHPPLSAWLDIIVKVNFIGIIHPSRRFNRHIINQPERPASEVAKVNYVWDCHSLYLVSTFPDQWYCHILLEINDMPLQLWIFFDYQCLTFWHTWSNFRPRYRPNQDATTANLITNINSRTNKLDPKDLLPLLPDFL